MSPPQKSRMGFRIEWEKGHHRIPLLQHSLHGGRHQPQCPKPIQVTDLRPMPQIDGHGPPREIESTAIAKRERQTDDGGGALPSLALPSLPSVPAIPRSPFFVPTTSTHPLILPSLGGFQQRCGIFPIRVQSRQRKGKRKKGRERGDTRRRPAHMIRRWW